MLYETVSQIFYPSNLQEFFSALNRFSEADIFFSDARRLLNQGSGTIALPKIIISADNIAELHNINRTERYIEAGAMVSLNQILKLDKVVPEALRQALDGLYGRLLRGVLSIGGIICQTSCFEPLSAALIALDVRCELRTGTQSRWISARRLTGAGKHEIFYPQEILYRVRIPLEQWDFTLCRRFDSINEDEAGFIVFLARIQKDILSDVRIVFSGASVIQDRNLETSLIGKKLPLAQKDAAAFTNLWKECLEDKLPPFLGSRILLFIANAIGRFAD
jgi:CO/xanthine dehydrogenase FAD-binding subunit